MLHIEGPGVALCDRLRRRTLIQAGGISALGLALPQLLAQEASAAPVRDINCLMLWLWGAPSHVDTWDMKPDQSEEIRGLWKPISSGVPGMEVCEHLPRFAKQMRRITQVRTMFNDAPDHPEGAAIAVHERPVFDNARKAEIQAVVSGEVGRRFRRAVRRQIGWRGNHHHQIGRASCRERV